MPKIQLPVISDQATSLFTYMHELIWVNLW